MFGHTTLHKQTAHRGKDSVKERRQLFGKKSDVHLLEKAQRCWENLHEFRKQAERCYMYTYGDQWGELIEVDGKTMTQREYLTRQGNVAIQTNQIQSKVNSIIGMMLKERNQPVANARDRDEQQYGEIVTTGLQANCDLNSMDLLYDKFMADLVVRGLCVSKEAWELRDRKSDSWTYYVEPFRLFFDTGLNDPRFWDMTLIGQFYDESFTNLCAHFVHTAADYTRLAEIYHEQSLVTAMPQMEDHKDDIYKIDFQQPYDSGKCRVYEIWTKESKARYKVHDTNDASLSVVDADDTLALREIREENDRRREEGRKLGWAEEDIPYIETDYYIDTYWYCRFLSPDGIIIWEGESQAPDKGHPYTLCATPFVGGKIQAYIADAVDHQILINRTVVLQDWLTRSQAKGVTVVPKQIVPDDISIEEFANSYTAMDNMLFIDYKPGMPMPQVLNGAATTYPAAQLIEQYTKLLESSSGVSGAIQGKTPHSGTSAALYAQQTANSSTTVYALMNKFRSFMEKLAAKKLKNICQYYDEDRWRSIAGRIDGVFDNLNLNLAETGEIEYDLAVKQSSETPVHRMVANDFLIQMLQMGAVSPEEVLKYGYFPFADKLLQERQARAAEMQAAQEGQMGGGAQAAAEQMQQYTSQGEALNANEAYKGTDVPKGIRKPI